MYVYLVTPRVMVIAAATIALDIRSFPVLFDSGDGGLSRRGGIKAKTFSIRDTDAKRDVQPWRRLRLRADCAHRDPDSKPTRTLTNIGL